VAEQIRRGTGPLKLALVIDDNLLDADRITHYLKELGINCVTHPAIRGALEKAAFLRPNIILLDLHLPDGSGMELLASLKTDQRTCAIPVIIASVEERRSEAILLGATGTLRKPYSLEELRLVLEKAAAYLPPSDSIKKEISPLVMIADDNELILETIGEYLETKGCRVVATRSGQELLERAAELHPDIILMDIQMPGLDGLETTRRLRSSMEPDLSTTPVIAVTALAMSGDREKCLQAGANDYMSKPIVLTHLVERIFQLINEKKKP
jgi:CheY-like chemotaxis protein